MFIKRWLLETTSQYSRKKHILNQAFIMAGARVLGMGLAAIGQIWAARCLGPKNLGISGMVLNIVAQAMLVIGIISQTVLVREYKNIYEPEARNRIVQATNGFRFLEAFGFCLIAALLMAFNMIPDQYHFVGWFFIPILLLTAIQPSWIFQAAEKQHFQSLIAVLQPTLAAIIYLAWFKPGMSAGDDLFVYSIISAILLVIYWWAIYKITTLKGSFFKFGEMKEIKYLILKSKWLFISGLAIYVYTSFEQPLIGWLYSVEELGKYRTAVNVTNTAQAFFTIIPVILYPRFIEWKKRGEAFLWNRQLKLSIFFSIFGVLFGLLGFIFIPFFYPFVFGLAYKQAAIPCSILFVSKIIVVISGIFYWGLVTNDKYDKFLSIAMIVTAIFSFISNIIFIPLWGMYAASSINIISEFILLIVCIWASRINSNKMIPKVI